jgi:PhzF family phenazine biosynthesis protein
MSAPLFLVDSFTSEAFAGNPAGVVILDAPKDERWMLGVAAEVNQAETAFLVPRSDGFDLRWFTPTLEVDLCGHATLGSAHILWQEGYLPRDQEARFHTRSGLLKANPESGWITMDFPATPPEPCEVPEGLFPSLRLTGGSVFRTRFDYLVSIESAEELRRLAPDLAAVRKIESRGVIVTSRSDRPDADFVSRFFAPQSGVDEDPVTGSTHCALAPYWADRLGRKRLTGYQASRRGGIVRVEHAGDRVMLSGKAVTVYRATLSV